MIMVLNVHLERLEERDKIDLGREDGKFVANLEMLAFLVPALR